MKFTVNQFNILKRERYKHNMRIW